MAEAIVLIGPPGSGKSACGAALSVKLGVPFIDTDSLIRQTTNLSIPEFFALHGESEFRRLEREVLDRLSGQGSTPGDGRFSRVIAVGGGTPAMEGNWPRLEGLGEIVCLDSDLETLVDRLLKEGGRPLLADAGDRLTLELKLTALLADRAAAYSKARYKVDTTHLSPDQAADQVLAILSV